MLFVPKEASTEQVLDLVREWVDLLSQEDYRAAAAAVLPVDGNETVNPEYLESDIKSYRSPEYYPGVEDFKVTDWRTAQGGNLNIEQDVIWYKPNSGLRASVSFDLPLNGRWSDLTAELVFWEDEDSSEGSVLCLEDVRSWEQVQREEASEESA